MPSNISKTELKIQVERVFSKPEYIVTKLIRGNDIDGIKSYIGESPENLAYTICALSYRVKDHPEIMQVLLNYARALQDLILGSILD